MSMRSANAASDFDRLAKAYRWMEWLSFGPFLGLCRSALLPRLIHCQNALVLGDGDGRFTARLLRENQHIRVHAVDASQEMLAALTRACATDADRLTTELADLRSWQTDRAASYDLVVAHFFLDCLTTGEALSLAGEIGAVVSPGALWVISEFAVPTGWFGFWVAAPIVHGLYAAFGILTGLQLRMLPDHVSALTTAGFTRIECRPRLGGLLVSELWMVANPSSTQRLGRPFPSSTKQ